MGFATKDLNTVFYLRDRLRRWGGSNFRQISAFIDVFAPLATRPYARAAFGVPAYQRYCERIPKELLARLVPELGDVPFEMPWHPQTVSGLIFEHFVDRANRSLPIRAARKLHRMVTGGNTDRYSRTPKARSDPICSKPDWSSFAASVSIKPNHHYGRLLTAANWRTCCRATPPQNNADDSTVCSMTFLLYFSILRPIFRLWQTSLCEPRLSIRSMLCVE